MLLLTWMDERHACMQRLLVNLLRGTFSRSQMKKADLKSVKGRGRDLCVALPNGGQ